MISFTEILCKDIILRKVLISDVENIRNVRSKSEREGVLSKTSSDPMVFRKWLNSELINPNSLYLALLDLKKDFVGTVRIVSLGKDLFEWGSWALKREVGPLLSLNSAYAVYKIAFELLHLKEAEFKVVTHNQNVVNFHLKSGATLLKEDSGLIYFKFDEESIKKFLIRFESKFGSLFVID